MDFITVYQFDTDLKNFRNQITELKRELLAGTIDGRKELETWKFDSFRVNLKDFLHRIKAYGDQLGRAIRNTRLPSGDLGVSTVPYDLIKEFIFASPDYRSILGFTAGLLQGTSENGKLQDNSDIDDFFVHTVNQAFKYNVESTGELLEKCQFVRDSVERMSILDLKLFDSLIAYPDIFKVSDVGAIFTSASRSLTAIISHLGGHVGCDTNCRLKDIALLNSYCEYLNFTVTAYYARTFMIGYYFAPIWYRVSGPAESSVTEYGESVEQLVMNQPGCQFPPLRELESTKVTDPKMMMQFLGVYRQLVIWIGSGTGKGIPTDDREYSWDRDNIRKAFDRIIMSTGLDSNILVAKVIGASGYLGDESREEVPINLTELYHNLKSSAANSKQALDLKGSAKDDIIRVIADASKVKRLSDLRTLARDSLILSGGLLTNLCHHLTMIGRSIGDDYKDPTLSSSKLLAECHMMLLELYRDLASASYDKAVLLEKLYRHFTEKQNDEIIRSTELNVPELISSSMTQAPETMRVSPDMLPQYQRPMLEYFELRDEFLRSTPGFAGDLYLTESGAGDIVKALVTLIEGFIASLAGFFKNFGPAAKWVQSRKEYLEGLEFDSTDEIKGIYLYKIATNGDWLKGLKPESVKQNAGKSSDEFTISLYPSKAVYDAFRADKDKAAVLVRNTVLFGRSDTNEIKPVTLTGEHLKAAVKEWVTDILAQEEVMNFLKTAATDLKESVKYLKEQAVTKTANEPAKSSPAPAATSGSTPPDVKADEKSGEKTDKAASGTTSKPSTSEPAASGSTEPVPDMNKLTRYQNALNNIWKPMYDGFIKVLRDEYTYLKGAYSIAQAKEGKGDKEATTDKKANTSAASNKNGV